MSNKLATLQLTIQENEIKGNICQLCETSFTMMTDDTWLLLNAMNCETVQGFMVYTYTLGLHDMRKIGNNVVENCDNNITFDK